MIVRPRRHPRPHSRLQRRVRRCARAAGTVAALALARVAGAQEPSVEVTRPAAGARIESATPRFTVVARDVGVAAERITLELQLASTAAFSAPFYADTAVGDSADFVPARPLPDAGTIYWRAIARVDGVVVATSLITGPRTTPRWLVLREPDAPNGVVLDTRRPRFVWSSAPVASPPGPWRYDITITSVASGRDVQTVAALEDTTFVPARDLDANTSYRWSVRAYLATGEATRVASQGSFVITSRDQPLATLLYQSFPNPFPTETVASTCVWFDLAVAQSVQLEVFTLRGDHVRTLFPTSSDETILRAGRYGRADVGSNSGCDARFSWDGRSEGGREVAPGVYLLRLRTGRTEQVRKILYRGR